MTTKACQPSTFSSNHQECAAYVPTNPPRYLLLVMTCRTYPQEKSSTRGTFHGDTTNMILVGSRKYPRRVPHTIRLSKCCRMPAKGPPDPSSSLYHGWVTLRWDVRRSWISGRTPMTYAIMARGFPWVTPYLLQSKWLVSSPALITSVAQWFNFDLVQYYIILYSVYLCYHMTITFDRGILIFSFNCITMNLIIFNWYLSSIFATDFHNVY